MIRTVQIIVLIQALVAAEQRSFRKASELLGVRTSTISRRIRELEDRLGVPIFHRHRHGIRPTDAGAVFLDEARRIVGDLQSLIGNVRAAGNGGAGRVRIGFYLSLSSGELHDTLASFHQRYPDIQTAIVESSRHRLLERLNTGSLDVILVADDGSFDHLETLPVWREHILVALPAGHRLAESSAIAWRDLVCEPFVLPQHDPGPELRDTLLAAFNGGRRPPRLLQLDMTAANILNLVALGCGLTLIYGAATGVSHRDIVYCPMDEGVPMRSTPFIACWRKENANPALATFLAMLREQYDSGTSVLDPDRTSSAKREDRPTRHNGVNGSTPPSLLGRSRDPST